MLKTQHRKLVVTDFNGVKKKKKKTQIRKSRAKWLNKYHEGMM